jgi:hypothetical protein
MVLIMGDTKQKEEKKLSISDATALVKILNKPNLRFFDLSTKEIFRSSADVGDGKTTQSLVEYVLGLNYKKVSVGDIAKKCKKEGYTTLYWANLYKNLFNYINFEFNEVENNLISEIHCQLGNILNNYHRYDVPENVIPKADIPKADISQAEIPEAYLELTKLQRNSEDEIAIYNKKIKEFVERKEFKDLIKNIQKLFYPSSIYNSFNVFAHNYFLVFKNAINTPNNEFQETIFGFSFALPFAKMLNYDFKTPELSEEEKKGLSADEATKTLHNKFKKFKQDELLFKLLLQEFICNFNPELTQYSSNDSLNASVDSTDATHLTNSHSRSAPELLSHKEQGTRPTRSPSENSKSGFFSLFRRVKKENPSTGDIPEESYITKTPNPLRTASPQRDGTPTTTDTPTIAQKDVDTTETVQKDEAAVYKHEKPKSGSSSDNALVDHTLEAVGMLTISDQTTNKEILSEYPDVKPDEIDKAALTTSAPILFTPQTDSVTPDIETRKTRSSSRSSKYQPNP